MLQDCDRGLSRGLNTAKRRRDSKVKGVLQGCFMGVTLI